MESVDVAVHKEDEKEAADALVQLSQTENPVKPAMVYTPETLLLNMGATSQDLFIVRFLIHFNDIETPCPERFQWADTTALAQGITTLTDLTAPAEGLPLRKCMDRALDIFNVIKEKVECTLTPMSLRERIQIDDWMNKQSGGPKHLILYGRSLQPLFETLWTNPLFLSTKPVLVNSLYVTFTAVTA